VPLILDDGGLEMVERIDDMSPGEVRVFDLDQEDEARAWVAASD
jgi:hypothetical protein